MIRSLSIALAVLLFGFAQHAYAHGLGFETISGNVGERRISLTTQITPTEFTAESQKRIAVSVTDARTNESLQNLILFVKMSHAGEPVFEDSFFAHDGSVEIDVRFVADGVPEIRGNFDEQTDSWIGTEGGSLELAGPVFSSGGLYDFEIIIKSIDGNVIENPRTYRPSITLTTEHSYEGEGEGGDMVTFGVKSYYDTITDFQYDALTNAITFEMPFDWSEQNISHVSVVHEEVHFPKNYEGLFVPSYTGKANGIALFKSSITVDDYSIEDERIVHFVLSQDHLRYLKQAQKSSGIDNPQNLVFSLEVSERVVFPVIAMTRGEEIQVDLTWDPITIEPEKSTRFIFTFRDAATGEPMRNTPYDFVLVQGGNEVYRKSGNAQIGGDFADYTFSQGQTGQTSIRFENIGGTGLGTEFGIMVVPEFGPLVLVVLSASIIAMLAINRRAAYTA